MTTLPDSCEIAVVGAGLAGLSAARQLQQAGRDVHVFEASDGVGGRVRSDHVDGFILDRGFQIMLTAYPEFQKQFDVKALQMQAFAPGALIWINGRGHVLSDPLRRPSTTWSTATAPVGTIFDKARIAALRLRVARGPGAHLLRGEDMTTAELLRKSGFSSKMMRQFFTPLVGGIQLDPQLTASRRMFDIIFRMLAKGDAAVPAHGMGRVSEQLAAHIASERIHLSTPISQIASGCVTTATGHTINARQVIVATEGPVASSLLGLPAVISRSVGCVYFAAPQPPTNSKLIILDGTGQGPVLNIAVMSNIAPAYAPDGQHLVAAAIPGCNDDALRDVDLEAVARTQLTTMFGKKVNDWRHLRTYRINHGQPDQSPPFQPKDPVSLGDGLFVCGDHRDTASIQGALYSGRRCAEAVLART
ncbi:MAG: hypothetical protein RL119_803 [Actinomycetota bacterium]|jgi:phytoene dehydrogenase-like protein